MLQQDNNAIYDYELIADYLQLYAIYFQKLSESRGLQVGTRRIITDSPFRTVDPLFEQTLLEELDGQLAANSLQVKLNYD